MDYRAHYSSDYTQARARFLAASGKAGAELASYRHPDTAGPKGEELFVDVARLGPATAKRIALMFTGTHGQEGYCGSAVLSYLLETRVHGAMAPGDAMVLIHTFNPWGVAHLRRTTENNVDLNRNFVDHNAPYPANELYDELDAMVCPGEWTSESIAALETGMRETGQKLGWSKMMDALLRGQYTRPNGMNYGGRRPEWQNAILGELLAQAAPEAERVGFIDWHTGIGDYSEAVFLCFNEPGGDLQRRVGTWWGAENVEPDAAFVGGGDGRKRPEYKGLVYNGVCQRLPDAEVAGAVIEFGTYGPRLSYRSLLLDRYLHFETDRWAKENRHLLDELFDAFCPLDGVWRAKVLDRARTITVAMLTGLAQW